MSSSVSETGVLISLILYVCAEEKLGSSSPLSELPENAFNGINGRQPIKRTAMYAIPHSHLISSSRIVPPLVHKNQRTRPLSTSSSYAQRSFEADLSPIIEDTRACVEPLEFHEASRVSPTVDEDDSGSTESYGQLLEGITIDYSSPPQYTSGGGLEQGNNGLNDEERTTHGLFSAQHFNQDFRGIGGSLWRAGNESDVFEDSILIPELTLTMPTPETDSPAHFPSQEQPRRPIIDGSHGQLLGEQDMAAENRDGRQNDNGHRLEDRNRGNASNVHVDIPRKDRWQGVAKQNRTITRRQKGDNNDDSDTSSGFWQGFSRALADRCASFTRPVSRKRSSDVKTSHVVEEIGSVSPMPSRFSFPQHIDHTVDAAPVFSNDGEHGASPLFSLPTVGENFERSRDTHRERIQSSRPQPRRRSVGFNMNAFGIFRKRLRRSQDGV
ncbi:hypothetical protein D9613_004357 [Agrocybe pediades]|uniref:Uncharacterized protein n=1 Tax=Agrocybe pediades TaxID=84607 RepID=A0A8H4VLC3_9AGAR|nr:hypothetical protein D9613_004357 [Agrocybe pediades]